MIRETAPKAKTTAAPTTTKPKKAAAKTTTAPKRNVLKGAVADANAGKSVFSNAQAASSAKAVTAAKTDSLAPLPTDVLRTIKNGDVNIQIPLTEQKLAGGVVKVKPGTVVTLTGKAVNGKLDRKSVKLEFNPPIDGPLWVDVRGAKLDDEGRVQIDIKGFPDLKLGPKLPESMSGVADALQGTIDEKKIGVNFLGFELGKFGPGDLPKTGGDKKGPGLDPTKFVDLDAIRVSVKNAEFNSEKLQLGNSGSIQMGPGAKFDVSGTLRDLSVKGHVNIKNVALDTDGVKLKGAAGSADLNLHYTRDAKGNAKLDTKIDKLNVDTQYAVAKRPNGDFISLAEGHLKGGSLHLEESFHQDSAIGKPEAMKSKLDSLTIKSFNGTIADGRVTIPDQMGTAQIDLNKSKISGDLAITPDRIQVHGKVDANLAVKDFQGGKGGLGVDVAKADLHAKGEVDFDSKKGFAVKDGEVGVKAKVNYAGVDVNLPVVGHAGGHIGKGSTVAFSADGINLSSDKGIETLGRVKAGWDLKNPNIDVGPLHLEDDEIKGQIDTGPGNLIDTTGDDQQTDDKKQDDVKKHKLLKQGMKGAEVEKLQKLLAKEGFAPGKASVHHIKWGDTLSELAVKYGTTVKALAEANHIKNPDLIYAGKDLKIPADPPGVFGPRTAAAVRAYQRAKGLKVDGVVGPETWAKLDRVKTKAKA